MPSQTSRFTLEVTEGEDRGARLLLDGPARLIGRAREADLALHDVGVSRRHVQAVPTEDGVQLEVCDGAAPFIVKGRAFKSLEVRPGEAILLGNTVIAVALTTAANEALVALGPLDTNVRTVLSGVAADTRAMAALHALLEALDRASTVAALEAALREWAREHASATSVAIVRSPSAAPDDWAHVSQHHRSSGVVSIGVPAPSDTPVRLGFEVEAMQATEPLRRMFVLAGRIFGSASSRVRRVEIAEEERAQLRAASVGSARAFLGTSEHARRVAGLVPRLAASDASVLLEGETGVGKSFVARLIHESSPRAGEPLRVLNCAAIPETLLESELFGHERGAFTGAASARPGAFEAAGKGTLLLDEVGELSAANQAKLLRVLEERTFERIGSNRALRLEARVICATNRDLKAMVDHGQFRSDLLFRISVVRVHVPALRERGDDLVLLAESILRDLVQSSGRRVTGFSREAIELLRVYPWPGNVRELRNALEHAIVMGDEPLIQPSDLPAGILGSVDDPPDRGSSALLAQAVGAAVDVAERRAIERALKAAGGNRTRAAALLGVSRMTLYNKLRGR